MNGGDEEEEDEDDMYSDDSELESDLYHALGRKGSKSRSSISEHDDLSRTSERKAQTNGNGNTQQSALKLVSNGQRKSPKAATVR